MRMKTLAIFFCAGMLLFMTSVAVCSGEPQNLLMTKGREARKSANVEDLRSMIQTAADAAKQAPAAAAYERLAFLEEYMCEAGDDHNNKDVVKRAAEDGVSAARKAVEMDPGSSQAHVLLGSLLGQLIPYVSMGGMRYGPESTRELEKGIQLDSKNSCAYMGRAIAYYLTPSMFGGSKQQAAELLHKAVIVAPGSDCAATSYIWLAQVDLALGKKDEARQDIANALKLEPGRAFAQQVAKQIEKPGPQ